MNGRSENNIDEFIQKLAHIMTENIKQMQYLQTSITGLGKDDLKAIELDNKLQELSQNLSATGNAIMSVGKEYCKSLELGLDALNKQNAVLDALKNNLNEYPKKHIDAHQSFNALQTQLTGQIAKRLNNVPLTDGLEPKLKEIRDLVSSPEMKEKLKSVLKDLNQMCSASESVINSLATLQQSVSNIKTKTNDIYKNCATAHKNLAQVAQDVARKMKASPSAPSASKGEEAKLSASLGIYAAKPNAASSAPVHPASKGISANKK